MGALLANYRANDNKKQVTKVGDCPSRGMQFTLGFIENKFSNILHASTDELYEKMNDKENNPNIIILDIREEKEYNISHIPSAICISPNETPENIVNKLNLNMSNMEKLQSELAHSIDQPAYVHHH